MRESSIKGGFTKKLILSMLLVGLLPLVVGLSMAFYLGMREIQEVNGVNFQALAIETARRVDLVVAEEQTKNQRITKNPALIQELEQRRDEILSLDSAAVHTLLQNEQSAWSTQDSPLKSKIIGNALSALLTQAVLGSNTGYTTATSMVARSATRCLFITDVSGRLVATTDPGVSYLHGHKSWWTGAFHHKVGKPYLGNLEFDDRLKTHTFSISLPIMDSIHYQAVGVLHRVYDVKEFFAPTIDPIQFGKTGHVMLIDSEGRVLSCPILATGVQIANHDLIPLVTPLDPGWVSAPGDGHGNLDESIIGFAVLPAMSRISLESSGQAWHIFVWKSSQELFAPVIDLGAWILSFGALACVLLIALGILVSRRVVRPIRELQHAATLSAHQELTEPIVIKTGDEIEGLADELNTMNAQLQTAFSRLAGEVETQTQEVAYLRESTTQILEGIPDPVVMVDEHLHVQYMNQAFQQVVDGEKWTGEEENLFEIISTDPQQQRELVQELPGFPVPPEAAHSTNGAKDAPHASRMNDPLLQHRESPSFTKEPVLTIKDQIFRYAWFPIAARAGKGQKYGLVLRDATDEKRLQDEIINSEKLTSLGILCSGIGHELNNPLVGVIGLGQAIQEENDSRIIKEHAQGIVQQGQRMAQVIRDLTGQIRGQTKGQREGLNLNEQLDLIMSYMAIQDTHPDILIRKDYQELLPYDGMPEELRLIFFHVIKNAIQAMGDKGQLSLRTHMKDATWIEVKIEDTGPGIPPSHQNKIFDPYFTTKTQGEGNGLGLTIVQRIVHKYGGNIMLESQEGHGATCTITLPIEHKKQTKEGTT